MPLRYIIRLVKPMRMVGVRALSQVGDHGSGAGKGGGGGGSIREVGGSFGKMEVANEEKFFRKIREEQIKEMKKDLEEEKLFIEAEIARHEEAIKRHKDRIADLDDDVSSDSD